VGWVGCEVQRSIAGGLFVALLFLVAAWLGCSKVYIGSRERFIYVLHLSSEHYMNIKESSPFTPGSPVPVELFVGRSKQIKEILRYVEQTKYGKQENVFLSGERGIGKSSLETFLCHMAVTKMDVIGIHVFLGGVSSLEEAVRRILDQLLKETRGQEWFEDIKQFFGKYIREVGLFGVSVSFVPPEQDLRELVRSFSEVLDNLLQKIDGKKAGLFIALDDINGLADKEEFANWYKSFVDEVATHYENFPVFIMLTGLPEKRDALATHQPSLMRIFRVTEIEKLSDEEIEDFLSAAFEKANIKVEPDAMDLMVTYSSGLPILMHEIGDATFWVDDDGVIDEDDAITGVLAAAEEVGKKYLDPKVYRAIRSKNYRSILKKLGEGEISREFIKKDVEARLNESEKKVFHNFLRRMKDLGVIESDLERGKGAYRFVNEIYPIYIWMKSEGLKPRRKKA